MQNRTKAWKIPSFARYSMQEARFSRRERHKMNFLFPAYCMGFNKYINPKEVWRIFQL